MGLLERADWTARWIGRPERLADGRGRADAAAAAPRSRSPRRSRAPGSTSPRSGSTRRAATARASAIDQFTPGWTDYRRPAPVPDLRRHRPRCAPATTPSGSSWPTAGTPGWVGLRRPGDLRHEPELLAQLVVDLDDGTHDASSPPTTHWRSAAAAAPPPTCSWARTSTPRWHRTGGPSLGSTTTPGAGATHRGPEAALVASAAPPVRVVAELRCGRAAPSRAGPRRSSTSARTSPGGPGSASAGPRARPSRCGSPRCSTTTATLYTANLRTARATDTLRARRRRASRCSSPRSPSTGSATSRSPARRRAAARRRHRRRVRHRPRRRPARSQCSDPLVNQLTTNIVWGQRGNFLEVPTDCPQRDERLGWTGDAQVFVATACFNADVARVPRPSGCSDLVDGQTRRRRVPRRGAPARGREPRRGRRRPGLGRRGRDRAVVVVRALRRPAAARAVLSRPWPPGSTHVRRANPDLLWRNRRHGDMGDWLSRRRRQPEGGDRHQLLRAGRAALVARAADVARSTTHDAPPLRTLAAAIRRRVSRRAYVDDDGRIDGDTQTVYALALRFGLVPDGATRTSPSASWPTSSGGAGTCRPASSGSPTCCPRSPSRATSTSRTASSTRTRARRGCYPVLHGATTIWERWDGWTEERRIPRPGDELVQPLRVRCRRRVAVRDRRRHPGPGYERVVLDPQPGGTLTWAEATYRSPARGHRRAVGAGRRRAHRRRHAAPWLRRRAALADG